MSHMDKPYVGKPTWLLELPAELRNQVYRDVFDDGKVVNLKLLQTCKQINSEASAIGFLNTTFNIKTTAAKLRIRAELLSDEQKGHIRSVFAEVRETVTFNGLKIMSRQSILPTEVTLLTTTMSRLWLAGPLLKCYAGLKFILPDVAQFNANLRKVVVQYGDLHDNEYPAWVMDPAHQLREIDGCLKDWVDIKKNIHDPSLKEKSRNKYGVSAVEISFRVLGEKAARVFTVQWDIVPVLE